MYEFDYSRPASLDDAARGLGDAEAKLVAGGMTLIPTLKLRLAKPTQLIDLGAIPSLKGISEEGDSVVIGAMTRHVEVSRSDVVPTTDVVRRWLENQNALDGSLVGESDKRYRRTVRCRWALGDKIWQRWQRW